MLSNIIGLAGWSYLPDLIARQLLPYFHKFYHSILHRPVPAPNTPQYFQHYRYVYAVVVLSYLFYNFREAALSMSPNYYEILGVSPTAPDATLKTAFRQFAKKNHPDRVGPQGETLFIEVRDAFEALKNPITRFAYDRFGPEALSWQNCTTLREYIRQGLMQSAGFHIVSVCALVLFSAIGKPSPVAFWRYLLFGALFAYELIFLLSPSPSTPSDTSLSSLLYTDPASPSHNSIFALLWPRRVAYQHIRFLHSLFMLCSVALSRVAPVLFPTPPEENLNPKRLAADLSKLEALAQSLDQEASVMTHIELHSCHGEATGVPPVKGLVFPYVPPCQPADRVVDLITQEMENMVIESRLLREPPLQSVLELAVRKRQEAEEKKALTSSRRWITKLTEGVPFARRPGMYARGRSQSI